jgi:hypothetical protein
MTKPAFGSPPGPHHVSLVAGLVIGSAKDEAVMVRLVLVAAIGAFTVVLFAGCGGSGDDRAEVEANLQHYLLSPGPRVASFPTGAGVPRVEDNRCFKVGKARLGLAGPPPNYVSPRPGQSFRPIAVASWKCVVKFGSVAMPVTVDVNKSSEVVAAAPSAMLREQPKPRIYQNTCKPEPKSRTRGSTCTTAEPGSVSPAG